MYLIIYGGAFQVTEINRQQLIEKQEEYINRIRQGERDLIYPLWELLKPLTMRFLTRYINISKSKGERLFDKDDLLQESYIALLRALDYWDPQKGAFSAVYLWMIQSGTQAVRGSKGKDIIFKALSLDMPINNSESDSIITLGDTVEDNTASECFEEAEQRAYIKELRAAFEEINKQLNSEQIAAIRAKYYKDNSMVQGMSMDQIRAAERKAMRIYHNPLNRKKLERFVDIRYSNVGFKSFINNQASSVELMIERLFTIEKMSNQ